MLLDEVRQLRAKRAREMAEYRRSSVSQSQELQKVVANLKESSERELETLKKKMVADFERERRAIKASVTEEVEKKKTAAVQEVRGWKRVWG